MSETYTRAPGGDDLADEAPGQRLAEQYMRQWPELRGLHLSLDRLYGDEDPAEVAARNRIAATRQRHPDWVDSWDPGLRADVLGPGEDPYVG